MAGSIAKTSSQLVTDAFETLPRRDLDARGQSYRRWTALPEAAGASDGDVCVKQAVPK